MYKYTVVPCVHNEGMYIHVQIYSGATVYIRRACIFMYIYTVVPCVHKEGMYIHVQIYSGAMCT